MRLNAVTLGYAVPLADFEGQIHSAFRSATYLRIDRDWDLLTLVTSSEANLPRGIRVDTPPGLSFEALHPGEPVSCHHGTLLFRTADLEVVLRSARRWDFDLSTCFFEALNPSARDAWGLIWRAVNERQRTHAAQMVAAELMYPRATEASPTMRRLASGISDLLAATASLNSPAAGVRQLVGLGQGVTPTGDDVLVGYVTGLFCSMGENSERREYALRLGKTLIDLGKSTSEISRSFLYHAASGHVSSRLAELAAAICNAVGPDQLMNAANSAMSVGHTSGMDAVTGLLIGLAAWNRRLVP